jgi:hypothetical protein
MGRSLSVVAQFEICISQGVIPKSPRFYQRVEGSPVAHSVVAGDPSLRLKNGSAQDDAIDGAKMLSEIQNGPLPPFPHTSGLLGYRVTIKTREDIHDTPSTPT